MSEDSMAQDEKLFRGVSFIPCFHYMVEPFEVARTMPLLTLKEPFLLVCFFNLCISVTERLECF